MKAAASKTTTNGQQVTSPTPQQGHITIPAPRLRMAAFRIRGTSPYVQHKFAHKVTEQLRAIQEAGSQSKKGKTRQARDFDADYRGATYVMPDGGHGIPCAGFRAAMISACRLVNFKMTRAKLAISVLADGYDDTTALVKFTKGVPRPTGPMPVRNETGVVDLRNRPCWDPGWEAIIRIRYDEDQFSVTDVANLLARVGLQVGIGEWRPDSKNSPGGEWGLFELCED